MLGVIAGTGFERFFRGTETTVETPFGKALAVLAEKQGVAFISRHGFEHSIPPHNINHKANIFSLKKLGVKNAVGISSCGVISRFKKGDLVLLEDFIAFHLRPTTFFEKLESMKQHASMTPPFSKGLGEKILSAAKKARVAVRRGGIIAHAYGPRLETPAEIKAFSKLGANLVGMTAVPEAILAREAGLEYSSMAVCSNYAAGVKRTPEPAEGIAATAKSKNGEIAELISRL